MKYVHNPETCSAYNRRKQNLTLVGEGGSGRSASATEITYHFGKLRITITKVRNVWTVWFVLIERAPCLNKLNLFIYLIRVLSY